MQLETRALSDVSIDDNTGEFTGYITKWNTVDSYNSTFVRGCFKKSIENRSDKVKVLYNHETLIGKAVEIREDDTGCFVKGIIDLETQAGKETYSMLKKGILDGLSFGFTVEKRTNVKGIDTIMEVTLYEFGPVIFPANDAANVAEVRSGYSDSKDRRTFSFISNCFVDNIYEYIWSYEYSESDSEGYIQKIQDDLQAYASDVVSWAQTFFTPETIEEMRKTGNFEGVESAEIAREIRAMLADKTPEQFAMDSQYTLAEIRDLLKGIPVFTDRHSPAMASIHDELRKTKIEEYRAQIVELSKQDKPKQIIDFRGKDLKNFAPKDSGEKAVYDEVIAHLRDVRKAL